MVHLKYFGNISYYKILIEIKHVEFSQFEAYNKRKYSNRCIIATANGPLLLPVPLEGGRNQRCIIKEVKIDNSGPWQRNHWRSIVSGYNGSPWFEYYQDKLSVIFVKHFTYLIDWNLSCLEWSLMELPISIKYRVEEKAREDLFYPEDLTEPENPTKFLRYAQVFEARTGFIPNLSILDLLFCVGPGEALSYLI